MGRRTQNPLTDAQNDAVQQESRSAALDASFGAWKDREQDGANYVERMRPGLGHRLEARLLDGLTDPYQPDP